MEFIDVVAGMMGAAIILFVIVWVSDIEDCP